MGGGVLVHPRPPLRPGHAGRPRAARHRWIDSSRVIGAGSSLASEPHATAQALPQIVAPAAAEPRINAKDRNRATHDQKLHSPGRDARLDSKPDTGAVNFKFLLAGCIRDGTANVSIIVRVVSWQPRPAAAGPARIPCVGGSMSGLLPRPLAGSAEDIDVFERSPSVRRPWRRHHHPPNSGNFEQSGARDTVDRGAETHHHGPRRRRTTVAAIRDRLQRLLRRDRTRRCHSRCDSKRVEPEPRAWLRRARPICWWAATASVRGAARKIARQGPGSIRAITYSGAAPPAEAARPGDAGERISLLRVLPAERQVIVSRFRVRRPAAPATAHAISSGTGSSAMPGRSRTCASMKTAVGATYSVRHCDTRAESSNASDAAPSSTACATSSGRSSSPNTTTSPRPIVFERIALVGDAGSSCAPGRGFRRRQGRRGCRCWRKRSTPTTTSIRRSPPMTPCAAHRRAHHAARPPARHPSRRRSQDR